MTPDVFLSDYFSASSSGALQRTLDMIDDDALYWFSNETAHVGKEAVAAAIKHNLDSIEDEKFQVSEVKWLVETAEVAVAMFRFEWSGKIGGQPTAGSGRGTSVLKRCGESWLVVHEHLSKGPTA